MRLVLATFAAGFVSLGVMLGTAQAEAVKVSPHLTVFTKDQAAPSDGAPTILRGSATKRGTVHQDGNRYRDGGPIPIGAGSTLWLADPETGELIACEPLRTGKAADPYAHCFEGKATY